MTSATITAKQTTASHSSHDSTNNGSANNDNAISPETVAAYLVANPDFFRHYPTILADMTLPHFSGNAVSLIERQVAILRDRGIQSRHKLGELIDIAKENDSLFQKTQSLVLELLSTNNLTQMFSLLKTRLIKNFDIESVSLLLLTDHNSTLTNNIDEQYVRSYNSASQEIEGIIANSHSLCGSLRENEAAFIFAPPQAIPQTIGSAAIACRPIGIDDTSSPTVLLLAVAHQDPNHYDNQTGTLFLDYLADILTTQLLHATNANKIE